MTTLKVTNIRGRLFDEEGRCNPRGLEATVTSLSVGWVICVFARFSKAHVSILVTKQDLTREIIAFDDDDDEETPLFATGLLYSDEADTHMLDGESVRRAPIIIAGSFKGARLRATDDDDNGGSYKLRVDCEALLPFWIECDLVFADGQ